MAAETVIVNAKIVLASDVIQGGVAISEGKIVAIAKEASLPEADRTIDARGNLLIPGAIDAHVHVRATSLQPGGEDLTSTTEAAAVGGVTFIGIMPQGEVLTENRDSFRRNKARYEGRSIVDYGMLGAFSGGEGKDFSKFIPELWEEGAIAIKGYMHDHRPNRTLKASYDGEMLWALEQIAKTDAIANVHCENEWMQVWNLEQIMKGDRRDGTAYLRYSPPIVEYEAGKRFLYLCKVTRARGLLVHTSLPELVEEAANGKREGYPLYVETCPQYLYFSDDDVKEKGIWFKCAPTLRDKNRVRDMWKLLERGFVDTIASDHVPTPRSVMEEAAKSGDLFKYGAGMPHIEFLVNGLMNGVNKGWVSLANAVRALGEKPARIYKLFPRKGVIQIGSDADLVIVDMNKELKVTRDALITKTGWSSFEGMTLKGNPVLTMVRGEIVAQDRKVLGKPGDGVFVPRPDSSTEKSSKDL